MADCTYKTNRFGMPLLHFLGITSVNKHFSAAYCVMPDELEESYQWAAEQLDEYIYEPIDCTPLVFGSDNETALKNAARRQWPDTDQFLCYWHINKNVLTILQQYFRVKNGPFEMSEEDKELKSDFMDAFSNMCRSRTEDEYEYRWKQLQKDYAALPRLIRYLRDTQYPQRKEVARPWTSKMRHYGNTSTSKLEGTHRTVKDYLDNSRGDLLQMVNSIENAIGNWVHEYKAYLAKTYGRPAREANASKIECCDENLNKHITNYAMKLFAKQLTLAQSSEPMQECSKQWWSIYGIPCCHMIKEAIDSSYTFVADDFDPHWLWERDDCEPTVDIGQIVQERRALVPIVFQPATIIRKRGRPRRNSKRIPSQFEATRPGTKKRPAATQDAVVISDDDNEDEDEEADDDSQPPEAPRRRQRAPTPLTNGEFMDINHPSLAEQIDLTDPAIAAAPQPTRRRATPTSQATTTRPSTARTKTPSQATKKPRGRVSKARKEQAYNEIVKALSKAGCPADLRQLTALETDWYSNDKDTALTTLLAAMTRAGNTASMKQYEIMELTLCASK